MKREEMFDNYEKCSLLQLNAIFRLGFFYKPKQLIMINNNVSSQVTSYFSACCDLLTIIIQELWSQSGPHF